MITDAQVEYVIREIDNSNISNQQLKDDLVDHFCCMIEIEIANGLSFDEAFQKAYLATTPNGLDEIQRETIFLLNYKRIKLMKIITYGIGFIFSVTLSTGFLFTILKLPGAHVSVMIGLAGLAFVFFPMLLINQYKQVVSGILSQKLKFVFGGLSLVLLAVGTWFKLLHMMGAGVILVSGFLILGLGFLPFLFFTKTKISGS